MASVQFQSLVSMMRARPSSKGASIEELRARFERMTPLLGPPPETVTVSSVRVGDLPAEQFEPREVMPGRTILYFHGGGYAIGSLNTHRTFCGMLAEVAGVKLVSVAYRLAPENPFPAALEDAMTAYRWLVASGVAPGDIILAGDSAGGGLVLAALVALRDAGEALPAAGVCLSPWTDLAITGQSVDTMAGEDPMLAPWELRLFAQWYLGTADARNPLASPLYADLSGLPPLLIHVGGAEILRDDSVRLAERAKAADVAVAFKLQPEMIHVWHFFAPILPEGRDALAEVGTFIRSRFD